MRTTRQVLRDLCAVLSREIHRRSATARARIPGLQHAVQVIEEFIAAYGSYDMREHGLAEREQLDPALARDVRDLRQTTKHMRSLPGQIGVENGCDYCGAQCVRGLPTDHPDDWMLDNDGTYHMRCVKQASRMLDIMRHVGEGPTICDARELFDQACAAEDAGYLRHVGDEGATFALTDKGRGVVEAMR